MRKRAYRWLLFLAEHWMGLLVLIVFSGLWSVFVHSLDPSYFQSTEVFVAHAYTLDEARASKRLDSDPHKFIDLQINNTTTAVMGFEFGDGLKFCVAWALTLEELKEGIVPPEMECFSTEAEALGFISSKTGVAQGVLSLGMSDATSNIPIIGVDYDCESFSTSCSYLYWSVNSSSGCFGGARYYAPSYPAGWDNRTSSARGQSGCNSFIHYDWTQYGGASITCTCAVMGAMGNASSSAEWRP